MRAVIKPGEVSGAIEAPPSKSMAHRLLICAGMAAGVSSISNISMSDDIAATAGCLRSLGAEIADKVTGGVQAAEVRGLSPTSFASAELDCKESGSTLRFLIPIAAMSDRRMIFRGKGRLMSRPLSVYEELFCSEGLMFERSGDYLTVCGRLRGGEYEIRADISSQFISGLMMALPAADTDSIIRLTGSIESRPYIDMTMEAMRVHGAYASWNGDCEINIPGRQHYTPANSRVEGDWSNAAYLMALGADVTGLNESSLQGDRVCREHFKNLDAGHAEIDISDCPDLGPVLMAYAALRHGCLLTGTGRLRIKESDRGLAMKEELAKFGVGIKVNDNTISVDNGARTPDEHLSGHNDHRIVMALAAVCNTRGGVIDGAEAVNKSFPDYFEKIMKAGADITLES